MLRTIDHEIEAYENLKSELENNSFGKWVVVFGGALVGTYKDFQDAAFDAVKQFGRGPYLIRQVGEKEITIPASIAYSIGAE